MAEPALPPVGPQIGWEEPGARPRHIAQSPGHPPVPDRIPVGLDRIDAASLRLDERILPVEDDKVPEGVAQSDSRFDAVPPLREFCRRRHPDAFVGSDLLVNYKQDPKAHERVAPDLFVAFGVTEEPTGSYALGPGRPAPSFVLEILSGSTWRDDVERKPAIYARLGVCEYFLFDPDAQGQKPVLRGFELRTGEYVAMPITQGLPGRYQGVHSKVLGLVLCAGPNGLRWYEPDAGQYLRVLGESEDGRRKAEVRAAEEAAARRKAEARATEEAAARRKAEAEIAALRSRFRQLRDQRRRPDGYGSGD